MASTRLDSLTSLRWFAALAVFGRHAIRAEGDLARIVPQGATAVSFFFILSGFVLAWSHRPDDSARRFYQRRFARIYPAYVVAVLAGLAIAAAFTRVPSLPKVLAVTGLVQAWVDDTSVNYAVGAPLWSLSCEAFFYLSFPLLLRWLGRLDARWHLPLIGALAGATWLIALLSHSTRQTGTRFWFIYVFPVTRLAEFAIGIVVALALRAGRRAPIGLTPALVVAAAAYLVAGWVPLYLMWVATTVVPFTLLIAAAATADIEGSPSWLRAAPLVRLGAWSYAFYLLHVYVLRLRVEYLPTDSRLVQVLAPLAVTVAAAAVVYYAVERPMEAWLRGARAPSTAGQPTFAGDQPTSR